MTLDRVVGVEPGRRAEAIRNVPSTLDLFDSHFPRFPVLPGVLILGTLGALAELLLRDTTRRPGGWPAPAASASGTSSGPATCSGSASS